jgi:NDP-sugar pyrophosphorylase family protein
VAALRDAARDQGAALAAIHIPDSSRFATVHTMGNQVSGFQEKTGMMVPGLINAGLYAFTHNALAGFARGPSSFERDIAPALVARNQLDAVRMKGPFLDIGTPENYATADNVVKQLVV